VLSNPSVSIEKLAELLGSDANKVTYFNIMNRFSGDCAVHTAMRHGYLDVARALVRHGADPTGTNRFGDSVMDFPGDYEQAEVQDVVNEYNARAATRAT